MFAFDNTTYNKLTFNLNYCAMAARIERLMYLINLLDNLRTQLIASLFYYCFFEIEGPIQLNRIVSDLLFIIFYFILFYFIIYLFIWVT